MSSQFLSKGDERTSGFVSMLNETVIENLWQRETANNALRSKISAAYFDNMVNIARLLLTVK